MTGKFPLTARVVFGVLSLSALLQLGGRAAESSDESRPLRRWLANRQQRVADEAAKAQQAGDEAAARSWRQDPRYQYRGVFENWDALPNDSYGGRASLYRLPPPEAYQKMYGPPAGYPQTQSRGLGSRFSSSRNAKTNELTEQSAAPQARPWAAATPEPKSFGATAPNPSVAPVPAPLAPAPLPLERNVKPLPDASPAPTAAKLSQPLGVPKPLVESPKSQPLPATPSPVVAKPVDSRPKTVEQTPPAPAKPNASNLMSMPDFDFPDPPAAKR